jgi:hypothetical protein
MRAGVLINVYLLGIVVTFTCCVSKNDYLQNLTLAITFVWLVMGFSHFTLIFRF